MQERNLTNVMNVDRLLSNLQTVLGIRKYILDRNHTNVMLFGKAFTEHECLMNHQEIHTSEKPYKCKKLHKPFFQTFTILES